MAVKMIEESNVLTLDFWEEDVIYEGKIFPAGTLACDALNIPDDVISQMETLCKNLNQFMGTFDSGKANAALLPAGHQLNPATLLFAKIEDEVVDAQIARLETIRAEREAAAKAAEAAVVTPQKEECTFDDFGKMDIRTATVLEAERVPKTDKLLKLTIDTGIDKRVIVSGIAEEYAPEDMVGKQICILANLAPRKIRGVESKGMILMARQNDGKMRFITPAETLCNGAEIG